MGHGFQHDSLALQLSGQVNGKRVSKLHGEVSRDMWREVWPELDVDDVPITSVTNGVHIPTWISSDLRQLFE